MKKLILLSLAVILVFMIYVFSRPVNVLLINNYRDNRLLFKKRVEEGYTFTTLINHSVHKTPVYEYYEIDGSGRIIVKGTSLQDLGWGVPSTLDGDFKFENNMMVIENIEKPIDFLPFRISHIARPRLILGSGREIDLKRRVDNYGRIDIAVKKVRYIVYLIRGEIDVFQEETKDRQYE